MLLIPVSVILPNLILIRFVNLAFANLLKMLDMSSAEWCSRYLYPSISARRAFLDNLDLSHQSMPKVIFAAAYQLLKALLNDLSPLQIGNAHKPFWHYQWQYDLLNEAQSLQLSHPQHYQFSR